MAMPYALSVVRLSSRSALPASVAHRASASACGLDATRCIASSSRSCAQVQDGISQSQQQPIHPQSSSEEPQKLGKRARKALRARQRQEEDRIAREAKAKAKAETNAPEAADFNPKGAKQAFSDASAILRVRHMLDAAFGVSSSSAAQTQESNKPRTQNQVGEASDPTAGWSGSLFRRHISSLLASFGTAPGTRQLQAIDPPGSSAQEKHSTSKLISSTPTTSDSDPSNESIPERDDPPAPPSLTKSERMESQARMIFQAIREARERGIVDEDESFFYPYPEGVPPKDIDGRDAVWLNLGSDPEAWGREIPRVKDRWLEVLSLGLTKEITDHGPPAASSTSEHLSELETRVDRVEAAVSAFDKLVEYYDLEDHERLEQLGDSIVNMSSRLLAYLSYPDVNEGSLTRLSNYPTQNNFLALLFQECGLAARRDELKRELRRARMPGYEEEDDAEPHTSRKRKELDAAETEEEKAQLPLLIKRDADMFEAYAAAVFLSNGRDFNVVHEWLCHLFRPFQDQAYRFMVQRSEALARLQSKRAAAAAAASTPNPFSLSRLFRPVAATNLSADGLGMKAASVDPSSVAFSSLFPDFPRGSEKGSSPIQAYALNNTSEAFITDEFLTVAARARRQREERLREELRLKDQQELMNMGWFRKGFLNLRKGFRQHIMGKDVDREDEARIKQKVDEQKGMTERDRQRLRAKERMAGGVSIKSTSSKKKKKIPDVEGDTAEPN